MHIPSKKLDSFPLEHSKVMPYLENNLNGTNALSSFCLEHVDFRKGNFFTLLPKSMPSEKIEQFKNGGTKSSLRRHISSIALDKLNENPRLSCIFDDITFTYQPNYEEDLFSLSGLFYKNEIYYLVTQKTLSFSLLEACFSASFADFTHSLCILTLHDFSNQKELTQDVIKDICAQAVFIIVGAYDGEGYLFWEKSN